MSGGGKLPAMTDLPTRLRTTANLYDHRTAGLMRDAADEIERLKADLNDYRSVAEAAVSAQRRAETAFASTPIVKAGD